MVARFGFQDVGIVPVYRHVFDELEGIKVLLVALVQVGCHLERAVHRDIEGKLLHQCGAQLRLVRAVLREVSLEDTRRVVHRAAHQAGKRQDGGVVGAVSFEGFKLGAACRLLRNPVGIGAA